MQAASGDRPLMTVEATHAVVPAVHTQWQKARSGNVAARVTTRLPDLCVAIGVKG